MAFVPVPNVCQTNVRARLDSQRIENVFYWLVPGGLTESTVANLTNDVLESWSTHMLPQLQTNYVLAEVYGVDLSSADGAAYTAVPVSTSPGTLGGAPLPNNVSICMSHRTAKRGRSYRGRTYLPGGSQSTASGANHFSDSYATSLLAAFAVFRSDVEADIGCQLGVVSRVANKVPRTTGHFEFINSTLFTDTVLDSQRRRLPGRGT
jgi:hypothetical protein